MMTSFRNRLSRLEMSDHWINLFSLGFLFLVIFEIGSSHSVSKSDRLLWMVFANVICFNAGHVIFTFVNVWSIPAYRRIAQKHFRLDWKRQLAIFAGIYALFLIAFDRGFRNNILWLRWPVVLAIVIVPTLHSMRQSLGLSLLMNSRTSSFEKTAASIDAKSRRLEHASTWLLIFGTSLLIAWEYRELFGLDLPYIKFASILAVLCMCAAIALFVWAVQLHEDRQLRFEKFLFGLRHLVRSLVPFSFFAVVYSSSIHGLEYLQLQHRTLRSPLLTKSCLKITFFSCAVLLIIIIGLNYSEGFPGHRFWSESWVTRAASLLAAACTYFHYYIDSLIYRMRDPVVRNEILPMIQKR